MNNFSSRSPISQMSTKDERESKIARDSVIPIPKMVVRPDKTEAKEAKEAKEEEDDDDDDDDDDDPHDDLFRNVAVKNGVTMTKLSNVKCGFMELGHTDLYVIPVPDTKLQFELDRTYQKDDIVAFRFNSDDVWTLGKVIDQSGGFLKPKSVNGSCWTYPPQLAMMKLAEYVKIMNLCNDRPQKKQKTSS